MSNRYVLESLFVVAIGAALGSPTWTDAFIYFGIVVVVLACMKVLFFNS